MSLLFTSIPAKRLAETVTASATNFRLTDIEGWDGIDLLPADFGTQAFGVFRDANGTVLELFSFDPATIDDDSIDFVTRGLEFSGDLTTSVTANKLVWPTGTIVQLGSNPPQFFQWLKEYIDAAAIAGGVPATTSVAGLSKLGTAAQIDAGTGGDGTYGYIPTPDQLALSIYARGTNYFTYAADSVGTDAYAITVTPGPTAYADGDTFQFKAGTANTGPATLKVNALAAITIKKGVSTDLETGDILANQVVLVSYYNGTFQMISSVTSLASVTVKGIVEEATPAEAEAGTQAGGTGADLFINPASLPGRYLMGPLSNAMQKLYFTTQLLFTLWTGSTNDNTVTDFDNWVRTDSTKVRINPLGTVANFASTADAELLISSDLFWPTSNTTLSWAENNTIILDFWMKYISGTGEAMFGFTSAPASVYGDNTTGVTFHIANGVLYSLTQKSDPNGAEERTDISSGITVTNWNNYRLEVDMGASASTARFYVNGVLKHTTTGTGQPTDSMPVTGTVAIGFGRDTTNPVLFSVTAPFFSIEMNP